MRKSLSHAKLSFDNFLLLTLRRLVTVFLRVSTMADGKASLEPPRLDEFETTNPTGTSSMASVGELWSLKYIAVPFGEWLA